MTIFQDSIKFVPDITLIDAQGNLLVSSMNDNRAVAKKAVYSNRTKYYVKSNMYDRKLFNPIKDDINKKDKVRSANVFQFKEVTEGCFQLYLDYLKSHNQKLLTEANREANNG